MLREKNFISALLNLKLGTCELNGQERLAREMIILITCVWEFTKQCDSKERLEFGDYIPF